MVISRTPYRVSFAGGGTDLRSFYQEEYGAVLSTGIDHHMYVTVHSRFENDIRLAYSRTEIAQSIADIQHELIREAMIEMEAPESLEITTIGDVPSGTGLGSSSSLTVGVLNALAAHEGRIMSPTRLATLACEIEIDRLGKPIGRQDQYAAAFGGINFMRFNPDGSVFVEPVPCAPETISALESRTLLFYTGGTRSADSILEKQNAGTSSRRELLRGMRDIAEQMRESLTGTSQLDDFEQLLHQGWELKRSLGFGISNDAINDWYAKARDAGATGGKLLGAGGGGFLLVMAREDRHQAIRDALGRPRELDFRIDLRGSQIIFIGA